MTNDKWATILVVIALVGVVLSFLIPMPWGAIPAAITLLIACTYLVITPRKGKNVSGERSDPTDP